MGKGTAAGSLFKTLPEAGKYLSAISLSNLLLIPFLSFRHGICLCPIFFILNFWRDHPLRGFGRSFHDRNQ